MTPPRLTRRDLMKLGAAGVIGSSMSGLLESLAAAAGPPRRKKHCILLWMPGGPSQIDTLDPKPGHDHGGPFKPVRTRLPGIVLGEHLPKVAGHMEHLALIRSMRTREGDHGRAAYHVRTGYNQLPAIDYPTLGPLLARQLADGSSDLPPCVSIAASRLFAFGSSGAGFLGPTWTPLAVGDSDGRPLAAAEADRALQVRDMTPPRDVTAEAAQARLGLLQEMDADFVGRHPGPVGRAYQAAYDRAARLMSSQARRAFDLEEEKPALRDAYGRNLFGQGCLLARRLIERGVSFVEVSLTGNGGVSWDTHTDNFTRVRELCNVLDPAWATLLTDLRSRGLLADTLVLWMGEFGRTPRINRASGRDHFPNAWSVALAGGGIRGGQVIGATSADGMEVEERPVAIPDLLATVCLALDIDPAHANLAPNGRPIRTVDKSGKPLRELLRGG